MIQWVSTPGEQISLVGGSALPCVSGIVVISAKAAWLLSCWVMLSLPLFQTGSKAEDKAGPRWSIFIDSGLPEGKQQNNVCQWSYTALYSQKILYNYDSKNEGYSKSNHSTWSHTSHLVTTSTETPFLSDCKN